MGRLVRIEVMRRSDAGDLAETLAEGGLTAELSNPRGRWEIRIRNAAESDVTGVLERWLAERELPFIPMRIGERAFALRPPAA